jgi:hypothetical protein
MVTSPPFLGQPLPTSRSRASAAHRAGSRLLAGGVTGRAVQAVDGESEVWSGEPPHDQGGGGPRHREAGRSQYGGDTAAAVAATVRMGRAVAVRMVLRPLVIRMVRAPVIRVVRALVVRMVRAPVVRMVRAPVVRMVRAPVVRMVRAPVVRAMRRLGGLPGKLVACGVGPRRALDSVRGVSAVALPGRLAVRRGRETSHGQEHRQQDG